MRELDYGALAFVFFSKRNNTLEVGGNFSVKISATLPVILRFIKLFALLQSLQIKLDG